MIFSTAEGSRCELCKIYANMFRQNVTSHKFNIPEQQHGRQHIWPTNSCQQPVVRVLAKSIDTFFPSHL